MRGQTCVTEAVAYCGSNQCASVSVNAADITCPTGITATVENSGTSKVKITFKTTATVNAACEATIPVVVDGITMNKKFSFAVARTGNTALQVRVLKELLSLNMLDLRPIPQCLQVDGLQLFHL